MLTALCAVLLGVTRNENPKIDRRALVGRHSVEITAFDGQRPLQVGNGEFAFGMDVTGLQSFAPFNTMSHWGWHSTPPPAGQKPSDFKGQVWDTHGRPVRYPMPDPEHPELSDWLVANPHRLNLGRIGLQLIRTDGSPGQAADLTGVHQNLDLWTGLVTSRFQFQGEPVSVVTACHPRQDQIGFHIHSPLIAQKRLAVFFECPGDDPRGFENFVGNGPTLRFRLWSQSQNHAVLVRRLEDDSTYLSVAWDGHSQLQLPQVAPTLNIVSARYGREGHWADVTALARKAVRDSCLSLHADNRLAGDPAPSLVKSLQVTYEVGGIQKAVETPENGDVKIDPFADRRRYMLVPSPASAEFNFVCAFSPKPLKSKQPDAQETISASQHHWPEYWQTGGAIDLSGSRDPRWRELERRIVLSQYLMAVNEAGSYPPQESGLVNNGWNGRWHMEMYWWHEAQWALWNRWPELRRSLKIYSDLLPISLKRAKNEGFKGARWPKCIGPGGREAPHVIHSTLVWQQPHPLFFAELDYRAHPTMETLKAWAPVVAATGDFLASYAFFDKPTNRYVLGPPIFLVSENTDPKITQNPSYELSYWRFGLRIAQSWRERMGLPRRKDWDKVLHGLAPLPVKDGLYETYENIPNMWTKFNFEHPALIGTYGMLPGDGVDVPTVRRTLDKVSQVWNFERTWGWDYPMLAMCAAKLGQPSRAIDFLLTSRSGFQFDQRGLATGGPFPYFPSNGGLLYAVALMAAGWDGAPHGSAPGFPHDGSWKVRYEGLSKAL